MKTAIHFPIVILLTTAAIICRAQTTTAPAPTPYSLVSQDLDFQTWQRTIYEQAPSGQVIPHVQSYTELASGLNFVNPATGQLTPSSDEVDILPDGTASGTNGQHKVYFPVDIASGTVTLVTPDGLTLDSRPVGLSYDSGTNTVLIAELTNSVGELISSNQVLYTNAFVGIDADLLYTYRKSGLEQDVILDQQPPAPEQFGFDSVNTRLQMLTEFFNVPSPGETAGATDSQDGLQDTLLTFGAMKMIRGNAFLIGNGAQNAPQPVPVYKSWVPLNAPGQDLLLEQVPYAQISPQMTALPAASAAVSLNSQSVLYKVSSRRLLPAPRLSEAGTNRMQVARNGLGRARGVVFDYNTVDGNLTNFTWQGDTTYYVSSSVYLFGNCTFEGGTVIKFASSGSWNSSPTGPTIEIETTNPVNWLTSDDRPVIFSAKDDNSIGNEISGSSGSPSGYYGFPALTFELTQPQTISHLRISWAEQAISVNDSTMSFYDGQFVNCLNGVSGGNAGAYFRNALFANIQTNFDNYDNGTVDVQNATFSGSACLLGEAGAPNFAIILTNCILANVSNLDNYTSTATNIFGAYNGNANGPAGINYVQTNANPFETVGGGSYYLTNGCLFRGAGTTNIDPLLSADLPTKTTYPPIVYANTNISNLGTLSPCATRDTNSSPDLGWHYDPLDYAFGGCDLSSNNLTFTTGTAIGAFGDSGTLGWWPYSISLKGAANLLFQGNATEPCLYVFADMVQEGNGNWTAGEGGAYLGAIIWDGSGTSPQLLATFTKWIPDNYRGLFRDAPGYGSGGFKDCEFYNAGGSTYDMQSLDFTNCLFFRNFFAFWDQDYALSYAFENCTFYNGCVFSGRSSGNAGDASSFWLMENCTFDGLAFAWSDNLNANPANTLFNYNAYNTNNLSGWSYPGYSPTYGTNEVVGPKDLMTTNYNWESSWFGNFYLPTNSPLIERGSTNANLLRLYHFTTVTNQIPDGTNIVTIGYHYVATDQYGNPLDSNGDGIPDYLEDPAGNGSGNWDTTMYLNVIISEPRNGSTLP